MLLRLGALLAGVVLVGVSIGVGVLTGNERRADLDRRLRGENHQQAEAVRVSFARAREIMLLTAQNPVFAAFYREPGDLQTKVEGDSRTLDNAVRAMGFLATLFPESVGEISFVDSSGSENARLVRGQRSQPDQLSQTEADESYFDPTFALGPGEVYQSAVQPSAAGNSFVVSNSTVVPGLPPGSQAVIRFELSTAMFGRVRPVLDLRYLIIDANTLSIVSDTRPTPANTAAAQRDSAIATAVTAAAEPDGILTVAGQRLSYTLVPSSPANANDWHVVSAAPAPDTGLLADFDFRTLILLVAAGALLGFAVASFRAYQRRLEFAAVTDPLTQLPNRNMLADRVEQALLARRRTNDDVAVLVLDLDRFKEVNDTLGHHCGDELLQQVGPRIRAELRESDTVARLGGDEFAVLLPSVNGISAAMEVAGRILEGVRQPFTVGALALEVEASVGIALAPYHGESFEQLLQHADAAMYVAKESSLGATLYDKAFDTHNPRRLSMLAELRRAIDKDELELYYQPKAMLPTEELRGVEALLRWNHPARGTVMPNDFIPFAEHTALIQPLTDWVIEHAAADVRRWLDGGREIAVSVNVSARSLLDNRLCETIREVLEVHGIPSRLLVVEITETAIMTDPNKARDVLVALNAMGIEVSIDDFGTGYSSLAYLKTLPVHELKIDRSFVMNMCAHPDDAVIVRSVIDLGRNLGLRVIAEGVEDADTCRHLVEAGCQMAQGYLWSKPIPAAALDEWFANRAVGVSS